MRVFFGSPLGACSMPPFERPAPSSATAERCLLLPSGSRDYSAWAIHCQSKFEDGAESCTPHSANFGPFTICRLVKIAHLGRMQCHQTVASGNTTFRLSLHTPTDVFW